MANLGNNLVRTTRTITQTAVVRVVTRTTKKTGERCQQQFTDIPK